MPVQWPNHLRQDNTAWWGWMNLKSLWNKETSMIRVIRLQMEQGAEVQQPSLLYNMLEWFRVWITFKYPYAWLRKVWENMIYIYIYTHIFESSNKVIECCLERSCCNLKRLFCKRFQSGVILWECSSEKRLFSSICL